MVVPAREGTALEVIETELTLEVFVHALGPPAFFAKAHDLLLAHPAAEGGEQKLAWRLVAFGPFGDELHWYPVHRPRR